MIQRVDEPFKGKYPFVNKMANRCQDFDLQEVDDEKEVDKYLTEFVLMKNKDTNNDKLLQFTEYRNNKVQAYSWIGRPIRADKKINLPANQKGYDTFETTVGKLLARRIQI